MCDHCDSVFHGVFTNAICTKNEYCFFEHLLPFDQVTIECAEIAFDIITILNRVLPAFALGSVRFDPLETTWFFDKYFPRFKARYEFEAFEHIAESALALINSTNLTQGGSAEIDTDKFLDEVAFNKEVNAMLYLMFVNFSTAKYKLTQFVPEEYDVLLQEESFIAEGIDRDNRLVFQEKTEIAQ